MEPISTVVALCMFIKGELTEHRIQKDMANCLAGKRKSERVYKESITYKCDTVKAELEKNIDGSNSIKKIIKDE